MKKEWWNSGWWSVAGAVIGVVGVATTVLGLLFPAAFAALGKLMMSDPQAFGAGAAWVAILVVTLTDGLLAWALWKSVQSQRASAPAPAPPRPADMLFAEVLEGKYIKATRQLQVDVIVQNPGDVPVQVQGFRTVSVEFVGGTGEVVWTVEGTPLVIEARRPGRFRAVGTFGPNLTHTVTGTQRVVLKAVYLRGAFEGGALQDLSLHAASGNSVIGGPVTVQEA